MNEQERAGSRNAQRHRSRRNATQRRVAFSGLKLESLALHRGGREGGQIQICGTREVLWSHRSDVLYQARL